jgi:hypothetical protein
MIKIMTIMINDNFIIKATFIISMIVSVTISINTITQ